MRVLALLFLGAVSVMFTGCAGQRFIDASIEIDGKPILMGAFGVPDSYAPEKAWSRLENATFNEAEGFPKDLADKETLTLNGKVKIKMRHVDSSFAEVDVEELKLEPIPNQANTWRLAEGEVERTRELLK